MSLIFFVSFFFDYRSLIFEVSKNFVCKGFVLEGSVCLMIDKVLGQMHELLNDASNLSHLSLLQYLRRINYTLLSLHQV